jgi:predicted membrane protein
MRAVSLVLAAGLSLLLLLFPYAIGRSLEAADHTGLVLLLMGVCAAFVHGFGYEPERRIWRAMFHPAAAWTLICTGAALIAF